MKNKSIYLRLFDGIRFTILLSVGFLFAITCIVFMFYYTDDRVQASDIQLSHIENRLEHYFTSTTHYSRLILNSAAIQSSLGTYYNDRKHFSAQKINMSLEIHKLTYPAPYIYSISIYDKDYNIIVSSERKQYPGNFRELDVTDGTWFTSKKYDLWDDVLIDTFSYVCPIYDYRSGDLYGYTELSLSEKSIADIYSAADTGSSFYLLLDDNLKVVSKSDFLDEKTAIIDKLINKPGRNTPGHIFTSYGFINMIFLKPYSWRLVHVIPFYSFVKPALTITVAFLLTTVFSLVLAFLMSKRLAKNLSKPIYALVEHTHFVKLGHWKEFSYKADSPEMEKLISDFNAMIESQIELKNMLVDTEREKNRLEIDKVNEQIKPHFLYNTLDNIYSLASLDEKEALMGLVMNLSKFYRGSLSLGKSFVSVEEELNTCRAYLDIMKVRYHDKFDYKITCPDSIKLCKCPKLILLPLVENSIYHGIKGLKYKGCINVNLSEKDDESILFCVDDNGFGIDIPKLKEILQGGTEGNNHFALKHINRLLSLYYGDKYKLYFKNNDIGCTIFFKIKKESL